ncbi:MAG TPA: response regulator [Candidatus Saccharimonadales bacterium]|jgi:CheY-like chemotaxis protein|nr:response regulator [Candidatus Saccharimonadales bacterium]
MDTTASRKTILIADDDEFITIAYKAGLERAGYVVIIAEDGDQTIELIATFRPDLVLLDVIMPKQNGFEVLKVVKNHPDYSHIPVVMLTNLGQESDEQAARSYGADGFLIKANVTLNDVLLNIEQLLTS